MQSLLSTLGTLLGLAGALACAGSGALRIGGDYAVAGFELGTLFQLGVGLLVAACWMKLESLERLP